METKQRKEKKHSKRKLQMMEKPAIPIKILWHQASEDQKKMAFTNGTIMLEYWVGRLTKTEAAKALNIPIIRLWQMSQQASSGMLVGLLKQPTIRAKDMKEKPENDVKALLKKIAELERTIEMQSRLIAIFREMPGCRTASLTEKNTPRKEKKIAKPIQKRIQERSRDSSTGGRTKNKVGRPRKRVGSDETNSEKLES
jgi:hypothetical protein